METVIDVASVAVAVLGAGGAGVSATYLGYSRLRRGGRKVEPGEGPNGRGPGRGS